jgi:hypothetical protein
MATEAVIFESEEVVMSSSCGGFGRYAADQGPLRDPIRSGDTARPAADALGMAAREVVGERRAASATGPDRDAEAAA